MNNSLEALKATQIWRAPQPAEYAFKDPPRADHTPVRVTGGIGDLILALRPLRALNKRVRDVVVYTKYPEVAKSFMGPVWADPFFPKIKDEKELTTKGFDWFITMNSIAAFRFAKNFRGFKNKELNHVLVDNVSFIGNGWKDYVDRHPYLDNLMAQYAVQKGLHRSTITFPFLGLKAPSYSPSSPYKKPSNHITIHDGFDSGNSEVVGRSTKNWAIENYVKLVAMIKERYPMLKIFQLGGPKSRPIFGVDECFVGKTSFLESCSTLQDSLLHIDCESGLVHAAREFNTKCVVLFGPTNPEFFGYKENQNIFTSMCGDCWWTKKDWMSNCPAGYGKPECMDSISPERVFKNVEAELWGVYANSIESNSRF